ncbi:hypothetical protein [Sphingobium lignivorans]|uniref:Uncharacterized protein n=1 Tax=Sphingobium lignivorans TaxID=2735886 RepID=A0ABR6NHY7_9SPHN|nr:hypothetical protein [Sphingobium lignivorans]MBB5986894.1 hypothetical protein [Sphingobium lignivorans]
MKGRILGFDASTGSGAITSESGERFTFVAAQWRGQQAIQNGLTVDFEPMSGVATEIYPVGKGLEVPVDLSHLAASPAVQKIRALGMTTLVFPLAALLLVATLLPMVSTIQGSFSLWSLGTLQRQVSANPFLGNGNVAGAERALAELDAREAALQRPMTGFGGMPIDNGPALQRVAEARASMEARLSAARMARTANALLGLRWLVPLLAALLLWFCWMGKSTRTIALVTGGVSIVTAIAVFAYRQSIVTFAGAGENAIGAMVSANLEAAISVAIGTWLMGLIGVALVLAALGIVRNPLAARG